ncbi:unnamed protein product [Symbiodinium sp. CCMP2592]|nr:unnamed protein product [Symbiodinium sp. CCMP2592]
MFGLVEIPDGHPQRVRGCWRGPLAEDVLTIRLDSSKRAVIPNPLELMQQPSATTSGDKKEQKTCLPCPKQHLDNRMSMPSSGFKLQGLVHGLHRERHQVPLQQTPLQASRCRRELHLSCKLDKKFRVGRPEGHSPVKQ